MGCDGGTIPRRDELVRTAKRPEQVSHLELQDLNIFITSIFIFMPNTERQRCRT